jgi:hypothetical protein
MKSRHSSFAADVSILFAASKGWTR